MSVPVVSGSGFSVVVEVPTRVVWSAVESVRRLLGLRRGRPGVAVLVGERVSGRLLLVGAVGSVVVEVPVGSCGVDRVVPVDVLGLREAVRGHRRRGGTRLVMEPSGGVRVAQGAAETVLRGVAGAGCPVRVGEFPFAGCVPAERLAAVVSGVAVAADREPAVPAVLSQVRVRVFGGRLEVAATDRYRLAMDEVGLSGTTGGSWDALVPARWLAAATDRLASHGVDPVRVGRDGEGRLCLADESGMRLAHPASAQSYPQVDQVMTRTYAWQVSIDRDALLGTLATIAPDLTRPRPSLPPVAVTVSGETLTVSRTSEDATATAATTLAGAATPPPEGHRIGVNPAFLRDALRHQPTDVVELRMPEDPLAPMLLGSPSGYRHLLMPVRLAT